MYRVNNNSKRSHIIRPACETLRSRAYAPHNDENRRQRQQSSRRIVCLGKWCVCVCTIGRARDNHLQPSSLADVSSSLSPSSSLYVNASVGRCTTYVLWMHDYSGRLYLMNVDALYISIATKSYRMLLLYDTNKKNWGKRTSMAASSTTPAARTGHGRVGKQHHTPAHIHKQWSGEHR